MTQYNFTIDNGLSLQQGNITATTTANSASINFAGNSSGDGNGYTTIQLIPDQTLQATDQYLIIDPTAPGHIHIRAGGAQDNSSADLFLGGENSYFRVAAGANAQTQITSDGNTWVFNTDGNLQVPGNINGDNNAPLFIDGGSSGEGYIRLPNSSFGGEQIAIVNKFMAGNGIRLETNGGNLFFDDTGNLTVPGNISAAGNITAGNITTSGSGGDITLTGGDILGVNIVVTTPVPLANLTAVAGGRAFVNNSNVTAFGNFGNIVSSGGSNVVPVWSDGTNWYIG